MARVRRWSVVQLRLRVAVGLGPVLALLADRLTGRHLPVVMVLLVVVLGVAFAWSPDSAAGTVADLVVVAWWGFGPHDTVPASILLAALALLVSHVAAVVASYGPAEAALDPTVLRRWLVRGVVLLVPACLVWLLDRGLHAATGPTLLWPAALLVSAAVAVTASVVLRTGQDS